MAKNSGAGRGLPLRCCDYSESGAPKHVPPDSTGTQTRSSRGKRCGGIELFSSKWSLKGEQGANGEPGHVTKQTEGVETMKRTLALVAVLALFAMPAMAASSLYDQEGTGADGYAPIDATGQGPANPDWTNWKYQYGGSTWSGVYGDTGWIEESSTGDSVLDVEADIEMYYSEEFSNNKIYFHLGNIYTATVADKTAYVNGTFTSNNGMYIGISFAGTGKTEANMLKDGGGNFTGEVQDAMVGAIDVLGRDISSQNFNVLFLLDAGAGWTTPVSYGDGASGTIEDTLWWLVNGGAAGSYNVTWLVRMLPELHQPDGNYNLEPVVVVAPTL